MLFEAKGPRYPLPQELEEIYGSIGFPSQVVYSNFVTSLDGVVALGSTPNAGSVISARNSADRFLMGLLRACADAVLVGAGTVRATPGHRWTADHIFPDLKGQFAALRESLGRKLQPRLVVLSTSGNVDVAHRAVVEGATIVTGPQAAKALKQRLPDSCDVIEAGVEDAIDELRSRGFDVLLTEGGPHVMGELINGSMVDEAFLTISPVIAGRDSERRFGMVEGMELLPDHGVWSRLLSARRHGDFLFLRYDLRSNAKP